MVLLNFIFGFFIALAVTVINYFAYGLIDIRLSFVTWIVASLAAILNDFSQDWVESKFNPPDTQTFRG